MEEKLKAELKIFKLKSLKEKLVIFGVVVLILAELILIGSFLKKLSPLPLLPNHL